MTTQTPPEEVIARMLSNVYPPSVTAKRRAHQIINSLDFHGWKIASTDHHKVADGVSEDGK